MVTPETPRGRTVHRIGVNRSRWNVRVPRWFAMRVWLWIPGHWHWQSATWSTNPGPIFARSAFVDWEGRDRV